MVNGYGLFYTSFFDDIQFPSVMTLPQYNVASLGIFRLWQIFRCSIQPTTTVVHVMEHAHIHSIVCVWGGGGILKPGPYILYSSPSILQPFMLRPPNLVSKCYSVLNDLYFKTTCNIRPHFLGPMGGLKIEGLRYMLYSQRLLDILSGKSEMSYITTYVNMWDYKSHGISLDLGRTRVCMITRLCLYFFSLSITNAAAIEMFIAI